MKELTIEQKAQRYDEAIEKLRDFYRDYDTVSCLIDVKEELEHIFPELQESEDERIRFYIIEDYQNLKQDCKSEGEKELIDKKIAWLEKQGDKDEEITILKDQIESLHAAIKAIKETHRIELEKQGEQKPADKVVPKFKVGDWVVFNNKHQSIYQVEKIEDGYYILRHTHGGTFRVCILHDESLRLWTIQDAKDGDVLFCRGNVKYSSGIKYERICLFNNLNNAFFTLTKTSNYIEEYAIDVNIDYPDNTVPATKEQKEILFMVMKDVGYEWDAEKKS